MTLSNIYNKSNQVLANAEIKISNVTNFLDNQIKQGFNYAYDKVADGLTYFNDNFTIRPVPSPMGVGFAFVRNKHFELNSNNYQSVYNINNSNKNLSFSNLDDLISNNHHNYCPINRDSIFRTLVISNDQHNYCPMNKESSLSTWVISDNNHNYCPINKESSFSNWDISDDHQNYCPINRNSSSINLDISNDQHNYCPINRDSNSRTWDINNDNHNSHVSNLNNHNDIDTNIGIISSSNDDNNEFLSNEQIKGEIENKLNNSEFQFIIKDDQVIIIPFDVIENIDSNHNLRSAKNYQDEIDKYKDQIKIEKITKFCENLNTYLSKVQTGIDAALIIKNFNKMSDKEKISSLSGFFLTNLSDNPIA